MQKSYTKPSVSITQLPKLLKMALTTDNKEAVEKIHSGHFANCVDLYAMIQIINGVATLFIGPRYLLLRVKCIQWLNHLSRASDDGEKQAKKLEAVSAVKLPTYWLKSQNFQGQ
ncbi:Noc2p family [Raphanus sativus]|nr:Noc2p family [Raphanus sativus]